MSRLSSGGFFRYGYSMSGGIYTSYSRNGSNNGQARRTWPAMAFVFSIVAIPCAIYGTYRTTEDYRNMWARGYSGVSFGINAHDICGKDYPVARAFTARNYRGEARSGTYCASELFGNKVVFDADIADAAPPTP